MNKNKAHSKTSLYFTGLNRVIAAFLVSLLLIFLSSPATFISSMAESRFYTSLCFGFAMAFLLIQLIQSLNVALDYIFPWERLKARVLALSVLGTIPLFYIDWLLVRFIYKKIGGDFEASGFTERILPINAVLICLGHVLLYLNRKHKLKKISAATLPLDNIETEVTEPSASAIVEQPFTAVSQDDHRSGDVNPQDLLQHKYWSVIEGTIQNKKSIYQLNEVSCVAVGSSCGDIYLKNGKKLNMSYRKQSLRTYLDPLKFVETRGGLFVALDVIIGYTETRQDTTLRIKEDCPAHFNINISKRFFKDFCAAFEACQQKA